MAAASSSKSSSKKARGPKHPGVVLIPPNAARRTGWRARFTDPDQGRMVWETLDSALTTNDARVDWAVRKSRALARRRLDLADGAPRDTGTTVAGAIDRYFVDHPELKPRTLAIYRAAADKLTAWCSRTRIATADELTGPKLLAFRASLVKEPRRAHERGGKRGAKRATGERRAPATVNAELRSIGTVLTYVRKLGLLPRLTSDELSDGLTKLKAPQKRIHYFKPPELQRLLDAALAHDAATFKATRVEHAGGAGGRTPRYAPVTPIVAAGIITGLRFGHLVGLEWTNVDLDALDEHGNAVGEIVPAAGNSTKRTGVIGLEISPALRALLAAMRPEPAEGSVFGLTRETAKASLRRLIAEYGAPASSSWQAFRRTCGCYLTNAPGIFGAASAYRSARQLGHSVQVAERHYVGLIRGIPREARTLEAAMQIEEQMARAIAARG